MDKHLEGNVWLEITLWSWHVHLSILVSWASLIAVNEYFVNILSLLNCKKKFHGRLSIGQAGSNLWPWICSQTC